MPTVSFNTQFPGYTVLGELGRGNARVLKARNTETGELVAIKHFALNTDADTLRRFKRESQIMADIAHPNIVQIREVQLDAELPYIVMELIEGGSVRQLIDQQKHLSVATTIRLGLQVVEALKVIHARGIIHRDIKPENILYRQLPSGELHFLLTDFGIARLGEQPTTVTGQSLMTCEYASPEQFENPRGVEASTDYYSLGVVLYECLSGRVPFPMREGVGMVTFMNTVLSTPPPPIDEVTGEPLPSALTSLLGKMLIKKPAERIHNPDGVKVALKQAELEQLLFEQEQRENAPMAQNRPVRQTADRPPVFASPPAEARRTADQPVVNRENSPPAAPKRRGFTGILVALLLLAAIGAAFYIWTLPQKSAEVAGTEGPANLETGPGNKAKPETTLDTAAERQAEELRFQMQKRQEALLAVKALKATVVNFKANVFGGIRSLQVRVDNPTALTFRHIQVRVSYVKENGDLYKTENLYFYGVEPHSSRTQQAPDSRRGTQVSARVAGYESPEIPKDTIQPFTTHADR